MTHYISKKIHYISLDWDRNCNPKKNRIVTSNKKRVTCLACIKLMKTKKKAKEVVK